MCARANISRNTRKTALPSWVRIQAMTQVGKKNESQLRHLWGKPGNKWPDLEFNKKNIFFFLITWTPPFRETARLASTPTSLAPSFQTRFIKIRFCSNWKKNLWKNRAWCQKFLSIETKLDWNRLKFFNFDKVLAHFGWAALVAQ